VRRPRTDVKEEQKSKCWDVDAYNITKMLEDMQRGSAEKYRSALIHTNHTKTSKQLEVIRDNVMALSHSSVGSGISEMIILEYT
jgi:hypothetical protein